MMKQPGELIDRDWLLRELEEAVQSGGFKGMTTGAVIGYLTSVILDAPAERALRIPCKEGDEVWVIRSYKGIRHPQRGIVSDLVITRDLRLMITVKHIARGEWGKEVFATQKEAEHAIWEGRCQNGIRAEA